MDNRRARDPHGVAEGEHGRKRHRPILAFFCGLHSTRNLFDSSDGGGLRRATDYGGYRSTVFGANRQSASKRIALPRSGNEAVRGRRRDSPARVSMETKRGGY